MTKDNKNSLELKSFSRRKAVKQIVGGVSALAAYNMLPVRWEKPIIEQIFLPAHAAVSGITLSDPCTAELVSGNQESSIDAIRVSGFVTPPVAGLEVTVVATPNGGSGGPVTVITSTGSDGTYSAEVTMVGGPGIIGVGATTAVAGVNGAAHCSVGIPPADHPSAQRPQQPPSDFTVRSGLEINFTFFTLTRDSNPDNSATIGDFDFGNGSTAFVNNIKGETTNRQIGIFVYSPGLYTLKWNNKGSTAIEAQLIVSERLLSGAQRFSITTDPRKDQIWTLLVT